MKNPPLHHDVLSPGTLNLSRCEFLIDYCMEVFVFGIVRNSVVFNGNGNTSVHPVANHFSAFFFQGLQVRISVIAASSACISASTSFYRCCCNCQSRLLLEQGTRLDRSLRCSEGFVERTICSVFHEIKTPATRTRLLRMIMSLVISAVFCIRTLVDSVQFHCLISLYVCTTSYASHSLICLFRCVVLHCFDASELL